jgi:uncharacterized membrane protein
MHEVAVTVTVNAEAQQCFDYVADPANIPRVMAGIKRYDPLTSQTRGKGATFISIAEVAGREIEAYMEIIGWKEPEHMVAASTKGPKLRGSWTFEEFDDGTTDITLHQEFELPGVFKLMPGGIVRGTVEKGVRDSLRNLKRQIEQTAKAPARGTAKARKK